jgi:titin
MRWAHTLIVFLAILSGAAPAHGQGYGTTSPYGASSAPQVANVPPAAPSRLSAQKASDIHIQLTWSDNAVNEDGFAVEAKAAGEPYREVGRTAANVWEYSYFFYEVYRPLTTFSFRVRAFTSDGESPYSNEAQINMGPPDEPTIISAQAYSASQINLSWWTDTLVANKEGFVIERKAQDGAFTEIMKLVVKSLEPSTSETVFDCDKPCEVSGSNGVFTYYDKGLANKTIYHYRVRAFNRAGSSAPVESSAATY